MKYLITGLGNPGPDYVKTRHNIGFLVLERFAEKYNLGFSGSNFGEVASGRVKNKQAVLLKPDTFMNLSGKAVRFWMQKENIPLEQILIVTDDLALPFGKLRMRTKGSDGGHNGLKSVQNLLNNQNYPRLRFGIGKTFSPGEQIDYVLGNWSAEESKTLQERIDLSVDAITSFILEGSSIAMNKYNAL